MASLKAKQAVNIVQEPAQKDAIVAQYEKPSRDKAVEIYLWLADMYAQEHDIRTAVAYYNKVLQIDPENATAKGQIEKIKKDVAQAAADQKAGTGTPGGGAAGTTGLDFTGKNQTDPVKDAKRPDQQKTDWKRVGGLQ
jgi:tetratricopeptide (TPR) repeat protein